MLLNVKRATDGAGARGGSGRFAPLDHLDHGMEVGQLGKNFKSEALAPFGAAAQHEFAEVAAEVGGRAPHLGQPVDDVRVAARRGKGLVARWQASEPHMGVGGERVRLRLALRVAGRRSLGHGKGGVIKRRWTGHARIVRAEAPTG